MDESSHSVPSYAKIESTPVRLIYKLLRAMPVSAYDVLNRFEFGG